MIYNDEDNLFKEVTTILKQLRKVDAPPHFEADLMRRINSGKLDTKERVNFWDKFLSPARLVPSAAVALIAVIMLFVVNTSPVDQDDPLSLNPRVREDLIEGGSNAGVSLDEKMDALSQQNESGLLRREERNQSAQTPSQYNQTPRSASFVSSSITKNGLNFRQVNLTEEEKQQLDELKKKFKQFLQEQGEKNR
ncbi:MAG: hypothetical protein R6W90_13705 [Ignavibacteriaceae bacterium]